MYNSRLKKMHKKESKTYKKTKLNEAHRVPIGTSTVPIGTKQKLGPDMFGLSQDQSDSI